MCSLGLLTVPMSLPSRPSARSTDIATSCDGAWIAPSQWPDGSSAGSACPCFGGVSVTNNARAISSASLRFEQRQRIKRFGCERTMVRLLFCSWNRLEKRRSEIAPREVRRGAVNQSAGESNAEDELEPRHRAG